MLGASGNGSFIMAPGTRKDFFAMLFIFAADAVICLVYSRRKR
jgi:hypothetical protein